MEKFTRIVTRLVTLSLSLMFFFDTAAHAATAPVPTQTNKAVMPQSNTTTTAPAIAKTTTTGPVNNTAPFKPASFNATITSGDKTTAGQQCMVDYNSATAILTVKGYTYDDPHNMYIIQYDKQKSGTITIFVNSCERATYDVNGTVTYYNAKTGVTTTQKMPTSVYQSKKDLLLKMIDSGINLCKTGKLSSGKKDDFQTARNIVTLK
jgi:hypothetical protein